MHFQQNKRIKKNKKQLKKETIYFITHSDTFHADELLATSMLKMIHEDKNIKIVRTRDLNLIDKLCKEHTAIVYDVGFKFDVEQNRFDHHMGTFTETFNEKYDVKLSSAGLIFKYFHEDIFNLKYNYTKYSEEVKALIVDKIYREMFLPADALDNGYEFNYSLEGNHGQIYEKRPRSIQDLVASFNCFNIDSNETFQKKQNELFHTVLDIIYADLTNYFNYIFLSFFADIEEVKKEINDNTNKQIFIASKPLNRGLIQELYDDTPEMLYMILPRNTDVRIYALNKKGKQFQSRCPLKKEWRGKMGQELVDISGIKGIMFVHATGFTGVAKILEEAIRMCEESIKDSKDF